MMELHITRIRSLMQDFDVLLACSVQGNGGSENVAYLSGFHPGRGFKFFSPASENDEPYIVFAALPRDKKPLLVTFTRDEQYLVKQDSWVDDRRFYGLGITGSEKDMEAPTDPVEVLAEGLEERGLNKANVGVDMEHLTVSLLGRLRRMMPEARFQDSSQLFRQLRMTKSMDEVQMIRKAVEKKEKSMHAAFEIIREGVAESTVREAVLAMDSALALEVPWVEIGWNKVKPGSPSPEHVFSNGDAGRIDGGGRYKNYFADMARIGSVGEPDMEMVRTYKAVAAVNEELRNTIAPGVTCSVLFRLAHDIIRRHGFELAILSVGHGVGLQVHEPPYLMPNSKTILAEGMVLTCEPEVNRKDMFQFVLEDMLLVTKSGCESLNTMSREMFVVD